MYATQLQTIRGSLRVMTLCREVGSRAVRRCRSVCENPVIPNQSSLLTLIMQQMKE